MKLLINYLYDLLLYSVCVIVTMGGMQLLLNTKLNIGFWSVLLVATPLTFIVRDIRSAPIMIVNLGEKSNDDNSTGN